MKIDINNLPTSVSVQRAIRKDWTNIVKASGCIQQSMFFLPKKTIRLLGASYKTEKGLNEQSFEDKQGRLTAIVYLAPAEMSGREVCIKRTKQCTIGCLGKTAGLLVTKTSQMSMIWKTALRFGAPDLYFTLLAIEIGALIAKAKRLGLAPRVRLDGTSDLGDGQKMCKLFPEAGFYEYTKVARRAFRWNKLNIPNLRVALSFQGYNWNDCEKYIKAGGVVAMVTDLTRHDSKPDMFKGFPVIDGDKHDDVSADPSGCIRMLSWKGPRRNLDQAGPFAVRFN